MRRRRRSSTPVVAASPPPAGYTANPDHFAMKKGLAVTNGHLSGPGGTYTTLVVTNRNASGAGSLREAVQASGARLVVFEVSGTIDLNGTDLDITNPYIFIAGQTAPSPGITVIKGTFHPRTNNWIIQHMRFRAGDFVGTGEGADTVETLPPAQHGVFSHCSFQWGNDGTLDIAGFNLSGNDPVVWRANTSHHITIDRCIISETLTGASGACLNEDNVNHITWHGNMIAANFTRCPLFKGGAWGLMINNLIYNGQDKFVDATLQSAAWSGKTLTNGGGGTPASGEVALDAIGNYAKAGPQTTSAAAFFESVSNHGTRYYGSDNIRLRVNLTSYPETLAIANTQSYNTGNYINIAGTPWLTGHGITPIAASAVPAMVAASAGAFPWARDATDARCFTHFNAGTGAAYFSSQTAVGGYPASVNNSRAFNSAHWNLATMEPIHADALGTGGGGGGTIDARLVGNVAVAGGTPVESATTSASATTVSGSTFVIMFCYASGRTVTSVADNKGNTYTKRGTTLTFPLTETWVCENGVGGAAHTATVTFSANVNGINGSFHLIEVTGATAAPVDVFVEGSDSATPFTLATGTLAQANELILTLCATPVQSTANYASSNTTIMSNPTGGTFDYICCVSKLVVSATTSVSPSFTVTGPTEAKLQILTFKGA